MADHYSSVTTQDDVGRVQDARSRATEARRVAANARAAAETAREAAERARLAAEHSEDLPKSPNMSRGERSADTSGDDLVSAGAPADRHSNFRRRTYVSMMAVAGIVAVVASVLSIVFAVKHDAARSLADDDVAIIQVARAQVVNLLTVDKGDITGYSERVLDGSTGEWQDEFTKNRDAVMDALAQSAQATTGRVVQAGIEGRDGDTASVLVSASTAATSPPDQPGTSIRMRVNITNVDGQLKLSKVEVVR